MIFYMLQPDFKLNDFGRQIELERRYDDFSKLYDTLSTIQGVSLPPLPPKQLFGGNDPKVVEERRPALERLIRECLVCEAVLTDSESHFYSFLDISDNGIILAKFLFPATRGQSIPKLLELLKPENSSDSYRLFNESVLRVLLEVLATPSIDHSHSVCLDVVQFILSRAHTNPLASTVDVQSIFVNNKGFHIVWNLLVSSTGPLRDNCRKVLSSLISSNQHQIEIFETLFLRFLKDQNGLQILSDSTTSVDFHEIVSKLIWFGLSPEVQIFLANHPQGLSLLGKLFGSSDTHARCLSGLTLCVLITDNMIMDQSRSARAIDGVTSILSSFVTSSVDLPSGQFLSSLCRGSRNGMSRIVKCLKTGTSPINDFCAWMIEKADLTLDFIAHNNLVEICEEVLLANSCESVGGISCARFLYRLYSDMNQLPRARSDNKAWDLMKKIQLGVQNDFGQSKKIVQTEQEQYTQFQNLSIRKNLDRIKSKNEKIQFLDFDVLKVKITDYQHSYTELDKRVLTNAKLLEALLVAGEEKSSSTSWGIVQGDLLKEWNQSKLGMDMVMNRLSELKAVLAEKEANSKAADTDSTKLQQVITNMRNEIVHVDSKAEEHRRESSRFSAAAAGAVDSAEMLRRATEFEEKAKEEIVKREALRQSQDSLEAQLAEYRSAMVKAESEAAEARKAIIETTHAAENATKSHEELEKRLREDFDKMLADWKGKLDRNKKAIDVVKEIHLNCEFINKLIEAENEQKDVLCGIIGEVVEKLQKLQANLAG